MSAEQHRVREAHARHGHAHEDRARDPIIKGDAPSQDGGDGEYVTCGGSRARQESQVRQSIAEQAGSRTGLGGRAPVTEGVQARAGTHPAEAVTDGCEGHEDVGGVLGLRLAAAARRLELRLDDRLQVVEHHEAAARPREDCA